MACAGAFAIAWKPENQLRAIWVDASFPALFATLAQAIPEFPK